eukprot:scaffold73_cov252-Pinguiococcus_pyrenoidosus.AAC.4
MKFKSSSSFSVIAEMGRTTSGVLTPLRLLMVPGTVTTHSMKSSPASFTCITILPSSIRSVFPGCKASRISGCGRQTRFWSPSSGFESKRNRSPTLSSNLASSLNMPQRCLGPCRSARTPMG